MQVVLCNIRTVVLASTAMRGTVILFALIVVRSHCQPGTLDATFGNFGKVTTDVGLASYDEAYAMALQPDGSIVVAGTSGYGGTQDFVAVRYLSDGTLDPSFGNGGKALLSIDFGDDIARALALQPDGKVLLGGYSYTSNGIGFALARLNTDGSADASFGAGGFITTVLPGDIASQARAIALQQDGRIVLAGGGTEGFAVMRYMDDGQPDTTFGAAGLVTIDFSDGNDQATALALQPDGKILLAGYASGLVEDSVALARLLPDGSLDASFGSGGVLRVTYPTLPSIANGLHLMTDGRFLVSGFANSSGIVGRFLPDGTPDVSFNGFGWRLFSFAGTVGSRVHDLEVQQDGRVAIAGTGIGAQPHFLVASLEDDGAFDTGFGAGGYTLTDFAQDQDDAFALAVQPDGKLLLAGRTNGGTTDMDIALARYNPDLNVGVPEVEHHDPLHVWPVPAIDEVLFSSGEAINTIEVLDMRGAAVLFERPRSALSVRVDVSRLLPGCYCARIRCMDGSLRMGSIIIAD